MNARSHAIDPGSAAAGTPRYALGLVLGPRDLDQVLLLRRQRPESVRGKVHGFGATVKDHETPAQAMNRKLQQKAGRDIPPLPWVLVFNGEERAGLVARVAQHLFLELSLLDGGTDEAIEVWSQQEILGGDRGDIPPLLKHIVGLSSMVP